MFVIVRFLVQFAKNALLVALMNLKGSLLLVFFLGPLAAYSQYRNIRIDGAGGSVSVVSNARSPEKVIGVSASEQFCITRDGGETWTTTKVAPGPVSPTLIVDDKGQFVSLYGSTEDKKLSGQRSADGATWTAMDALPSGTNQLRQSAIIDSKGTFYVTWVEQEGDETKCESSVRFSMSRNGKKWSEPAEIGSIPGDCNGVSPAMPTVTPDGKVLIAWASNDKILLDRSFNGGEWWLSNDITVTDLRGGGRFVVPGYGTCTLAPALTSDNSKSPYRGSVYIVWADQRNGEDDTDIFFTRSHNFGDNWSLPSRVNNDKARKHQYAPSLAVDQTTGYVYILYYDRRDYDDNSTDVYLAWSTDGGASFKNTRISEEPFTAEEGVSSLTGCNSITAHKGVITPVWSRTDDGKVSVWTAVIKHADLAAKR